MRKIIFLLILFIDANAIASGDPLAAIISASSIFFWLCVMLLQFFIKSSKKGKVLSALNLCLGMVFYIFLISLPYNYKTYLIGTLVTIIPIFCGITNILIMRIFR